MADKVKVYFDRDIHTQAKKYKKGIMYNIVTEIVDQLFPFIDYIKTKKNEGVSAGLKQKIINNAGKRRNGYKKSKKAIEI